MKCLSIGAYASVILLFVFTPVYAQENVNQSNTDSNTNLNTPNWPKVVNIGNQTMTIFQPAILSNDNNQLTFTTAVGVTQNSSTTYGELAASCDSTTNPDSTYSCNNIKLSNVNFPAVDNQKELTQLVNQNLSQQSFQLTNSEYQSSLKLAKTAELRSKNMQFQTAAPKIFVTNKPSMLVTIDGDPQLRPVQNSNNLQRVINTPFIILQDSSGPSKTFYLKAGQNWMQADTINGPWAAAQSVPQSITDLGNTENKNTTDQNSSAMTDIIVSTVPATLIQIDGTPQLVPITGTQLMYVSNTTSDLFYHNQETDYYALLSGRWYKSDELSTDATWTYVKPDDLPSDFAKIPSDSPKANVLASIPSTPQAQENVIKSDVPQMAEVNRATASVNVTYEGKPIFKPIPGTKLSYATNTPFSVIQVGDQYYVCYQGVWFVSDSPLGPWTVATEVPNDIYSIPPSSPLYPVTYTQIYGSTPQYVNVGYTSGYLNNYIDNGVLIYGTGNNYPPFINDVYFGGPATYGFNFIYDPVLGIFVSNVPYLSPFWFGLGLALGQNLYGPVDFGGGFFGPFGGGVFINNQNFTQINQIINQTNVNININNNINNININNLNLDNRNPNGNLIFDRWDPSVVKNKFNKNNPNGFTNDKGKNTIPLTTLIDHVSQSMPQQPAAVIKTSHPTHPQPQTTIGDMQQINHANPPTQTLQHAPKTIPQVMPQHTPTTPVHSPKVPPHHKPVHYPPQHPAPVYHPQHPAPVYYPQHPAPFYHPQHAPVYYPQRPAPYYPQQHMPMPMHYPSYPQQTYTPHNAGCQ